MREVVICDLTAEQAEKTIAQMWLSIERFGFPSPHLSFAFQAKNRLSLSFDFENEGVAMMVVRSLSGGSPAEPVKLVRPPVVKEDWRKVPHESAQ